MSPVSRRELLLSVYARYRRAGHREKSLILDGFCAAAGYHRKYAISLLSLPPEPKPKRRRVRRSRYGPEVVRVLIRIWEAAGYPWSVRLKALLPLWMPWVRKRFRLRPEVEEQLLRISARQIDRRLRDRKTKLKRRIYGGTKPGTLLKHQIPIKTDHGQV